MTKRTIVEVMCDVCGNDTESHAEVISMDVCPKCMERMYKEVEEAYHFLCLREVPDRRGGWRQIGQGHLDT